MNPIEREMHALLALASGRDVGGSSRRVRDAASGGGDEAVLLGVGAPSGAPGDDSRASRPLPALLRDARAR